MYNISRKENRLKMFDSKNNLVLGYRESCPMYLSYDEDKRLQKESLFETRV